MRNTAKCRTGAMAVKGQEVTLGQKAMLRRLQDAKGIEKIRAAIEGWQQGKRDFQGKYKV